MIFDGARVPGRRVLRLCFFAAVLVLIAATLAPFDPQVPHVSDKSEHLFTFFALSLLGLLAWGRRYALLLIVALSALGGTIELLQATSLVGRDAQLSDWVADLVGTTIGFFLGSLLAALRAIVHGES